MGIKYLKGIYSTQTPKTTRPPGVIFPIGVDSTINSFRSANVNSQATFDSLIVAGGGRGGTGAYTFFSGINWSTQASPGGGGGAGGVRILSANNLSEFGLGTQTLDSVPVTVGAGGANSSIVFPLQTLQSRGGGNGSVGTFQNSPTENAGPGGSGGGAALSCGAGTPGAPGTGIPGQGFPGCNSCGGSALAAQNLCGVTTAFTGTNVRYGDGGSCNQSPAAIPANRGCGSPGAPAAACGNSTRVSCDGGSGIVAIRYRNPAATTTPLATGGNCVCCTGGCIIHIFNSSGFFNVSNQFSIN
jgi:hypothetical protein